VTGLGGLALVRLFGTGYRDRLTRLRRLAR
jgi:hypothetical protein